VDFVKFCHYRDNDTRSTFRFIRYPGNQGIFVMKAHFDVVFYLLIFNNKLIDQRLPQNDFCHRIQTGTICLQKGALQFIFRWAIMTVEITWVKIKR